MPKAEEIKTKTRKRAKSQIGYTREGAAGRHKMPTTLTPFASRALSADPEDVREFEPTDNDLLIGQAMLAGMITNEAIGDFIGKNKFVVGERMKKPVVCAWLSQQLYKAIPDRIGLLDVAMFRRALAGDVRAYEAILKRFDKIKGAIAQHQHVHIHDQAALTKMTDADLDAMIQSKINESKRKDQIPASAERAEEA